MDRIFRGRDVCGAARDLQIELRRSLVLVILRREVATLLLRSRSRLSVGDELGDLDVRIGELVLQALASSRAVNHAVLDSSLLHFIGRCTLVEEVDDPLAVFLRNGDGAHGLHAGISESRVEEHAQYRGYEGEPSGAASQL